MRLIVEGFTSLDCVPEFGQPSLTKRCSGFSNVVETSGLVVKRLRVLVGLVFIKMKRLAAKIDNFGIGIVWGANADTIDHRPDLEVAPVCRLVALLDLGFTIEMQSLAAQ
jgi:hypothetical protein